MRLNDPLVTRFPNGVSNRAIDDIFSSLKTFDPTRFCTYFEDFQSYVAANFTVTETDSGATQALADADGGVLLITNTAADNDLVSLQKVGESFLPAAGKKMFGKFRFKVSDATQSDLLIGLAITDTTPFDATDGIYFTKADASTTLTVVCRKNATTGSTSANVGTLEDDTYVVVAFYYDGVDRLYYALDGTVLGYLDASSSYLPDTEITPTISIQNGEAVAKTMSVDYVFVAKERD